MTSTGSAYLGSMLRFLAIALFAASALAGAPTQAQQTGPRPVVVELFTSQGCSSCPPADAALARLAERPDVVALSLHVDYWDYLGWHDTFAQRHFGDRQKAYIRALNGRVPFTPQLVVHGRNSVRVSGLEPAIGAARAGAERMSIEIKSHDGMLICRITPLKGRVSGTIWIAKYTLEAPVAIARGENAGREITYRNVVTSLSRYGDWSEDAPAEYPIPQPEPGEGVAVWLQQGEAGPIVAAAKVETPAK